MNLKNILVAAFVLAGLALSSPAFAGRGNTGETGRPEWAGNGNGATFTTTTSGSTGGTDTTGTGGTGTDPASDPLLTAFTLTTPSGNVHTTTLTWGTTADGQNILLEMQKLLTNHNGNTVTIDKVFNVLPEPTPTPIPDPTGTTGTTGTTTDTSGTGTTQAIAP